MTRDKNSPRAIEGLRFVGVGVSFVAEAGVLTALGWWLDSRFHTTPWLLVAGVLAGVTLATVTLVRQVQALGQRKSGGDGSNGGAHT